MNRISDEKYKEAKGCLKRFAYNKLNILTIRFDLIGITGVNYDNELSKTNKINDIVANSVIRLEENKELQRSIKEYKAVELAKRLVDEDSLYILEHIYDKKDMVKWEIIDNGMSRARYYRKSKKLIMAVHDILEKL